MIDIYAAGKVLQDIGPDGEVIVTGRWLAQVLEDLGPRVQRPKLDCKPVTPPGPPPPARGK